jgi:hypothetical protein
MFQTTLKVLNMQHLTFNKQINKKKMKISYVYKMVRKGTSYDANNFDITHDNNNSF